MFWAWVQRAQHLPIQVCTFLEHSLVQNPKPSRSMNPFRSDPSKNRKGWTWGGVWRLAALRFWMTRDHSQHSAPVDAAFNEGHVLLNSIGYQGCARHRNLYLRRIQRRRAWKTAKYCRENSTHNVKSTLGKPLNGRTKGGHASITRDAHSLSTKTHNPFLSLSRVGFTFER